MPYLVCEKCNGYYELQEGESAEGFNSCQCGGDLKYVESISYENNHSIYSIFRNNKTIIKVMVGIIGVIVIIIMIMGVIGQFNPDTSTPEGYLNFISIKGTYANEIIGDIRQVSLELDSTRISESDAVKRLESDKQKMDKLIHDLETIEVPAQYKHYNELVIAAYKDCSEGINYLIIAIKNHDLASKNTAISLFKNSEGKMGESAVEMVKSTGQDSSKDALSFLEEYIAKMNRAIRAVERLNKI